VDTPALAKTTSYLDWSDKGLRPLSAMRSADPDPRGLVCPGVAGRGSLYLLGLTVLKGSAAARPWACVHLLRRRHCRATGHPLPAEAPWWSFGFPEGRINWWALGIALAVGLFVSLASTLISGRGAAAIHFRRWTWAMAAATRRRRDWSAVQTGTEGLCIAAT